MTTRNVNTVGHIGFGYIRLFWQLETSAEVMEVDKQLKLKLHQRMQMEFISNKIDVMTHDCLSSVALALDSVGESPIVTCYSSYSSPETQLVSHLLSHATNPTHRQRLSWWVTHCHMLPILQFLTSLLLLGITCHWTYIMFLHWYNLLERQIGSTSSAIGLRILESLHIFKLKPVLNDSQSSYPLSIVNI